MPKSKRGPSLVELMRKSEPGKPPSGPQLPAWWKSSAPSAQQSELVTVASKPESPTRQSVTPPESNKPVAPVRHDRVAISFSSRSAGVTVFAMVALFAGVFLAGRAVGVRHGEELGYAAGVRNLRAETTDEIEMARRSNPNSGIFSGLRSSPTTSAPRAKSATAAGGKRPTSSTPRKARKPASSSRTAQSKSKASTPQNPKWITNYTYVIVQEFRSEDQADALEAREFLRGHGVSTTILESRGRYKYRLAADKGFNCDDANQRKWCDEFHARIQELGKLYVKAGGRYDLQGYQKKLTGAGW